LRQHVRDALDGGQAYPHRSVLGRIDKFRQRYGTKGAAKTEPAPPAA
jgi:hypothetical protein